MNHDDGSCDGLSTLVDVLLEPQDGEWVLLPRSEVGRTALVRKLGADPRSLPVDRGVEVSPEGAQLVVGLLQADGVSVGAVCETCRAALKRVM